MTINGRPIVDDQLNVPPEQRNIGMIFQDYALFPHLTVAENVSFGLTCWTKTDVTARVQEMLMLVKLEGLESRYPHQLSGGQQQRVAIARALACKPDLLLLDEPFSNIDTQVRHSLIKEIRKIFKEQGVTAIFVTHSREEAFAFADKLAAKFKVLNSSVNTTAAIVTTNDDVFDLKHIHGVLDDGEAIQISMNHLVRHITVNKQFSRI
eukprot:maker-scaffold312_size212576-snap-gene-0.16 protein:Tk12413 transcript:maker-scaffold312_size212576-snap-gene-0.16-mRNA-1 annotation:"abc transporter"